MWHRGTANHRNATLEFLAVIDMEMKGNLSLFPGGIHGILKLSTHKGGYFVAEQQNQIIGFVGYTAGDPTTEYQDGSIAYILYVAINKAWRGNQLRSMLHSVLPSLAQEFRYLQWRSPHNQNAALFRKLASPIRKDSNLRGEPSVLYSTYLHDLQERYTSEG
jgi:uncharacterized protein GlcG (DUF336 family)